MVYTLKGSKPLVGLSQRTSTSLSEQTWKAYYWSDHKYPSDVLGPHSLLQIRIKSVLKSALKTAVFCLTVNTKPQIFICQAHLRSVGLFSPELWRLWASIALDDGSARLPWWLFPSRFFVEVRRKWLWLLRVSLYQALHIISKSISSLPDFQRKLIHEIQSGVLNLWQCLPVTHSEAIFFRIGMSWAVVRFEIGECFKFQCFHWLSSWTESGKNKNRNRIKAQELRFSNLKNFLSLWITWFWLSNAFNSSAFHSNLLLAFKA